MRMQIEGESRSATWSFCLMAALNFSQIQPLAAAESKAAEPSDVSAIGTLSGFVVNVANGTFLTGVEVRTRPQAGQAVSNLDGIFQMDVPAGTYELEVQKEGYIPQVIRGVKVAEADQASEAALLVERKTAPTESDSIGAQEMSRMVGSDASDVMQRVTGVSIVDNKYVYIRGRGSATAPPCSTASWSPPPVRTRRWSPWTSFPPRCCRTSAPRSPTLPTSRASSPAAW